MTKRLKYIDFARGLTMLTILWGHVMLSGKTNILVYSFHIPVFFFLSGTVFKKEKYPSLFSLLKRRFFTLLIPYLIYSVATWGFWVLDSYTKGNSLVNCHKPLLETFIARGSAGYMIHNPALWFVTCLFMVEVLYYFICKLPKAVNLLVCALCALAAFFMMLPDSFFDFTALPWNIEVALSAVIFYGLGNLFSQQIDSAKLVAFSKKHPLLLLLSCCVAFTVMYFGAVWNGHVSMAQCKLGEKNTLVFYIVAFFGIAFVLLGCLFLEGIYGRLKFIDRISDYFLWIGRNSFYFMVLHIPCMLVAVRVVARIAGLGITEVRNDYIYTLPAWVMMMIGSTVLTLIINGIKSAVRRKYVKLHN